MARGRMLSKRISDDKRLISIDQAAGPYGLVFLTWLQAHLDVEGRLTGEPVLLKAKVCPWHAGCTMEVIEQTLAAAERLGYLLVYEVDGTRWLQWNHFHSEQPGLRPDREAKSEAPPPPDVLRSNSGVAPEPVRSCSAASISSDFINPQNEPVDSVDAAQQAPPERSVKTPESPENIQLRSNSGATPEPVRSNSALKIKFKVKEKDQEQQRSELLLAPSGDAPEQPASAHAAPRPSPPADPSVCAIPLKGGHDHHVRASYVAELRESFPGVDVDQEVRAMRAWCLANPARRKTQAGVKAFITRWLQRTQDQPRPMQPRPSKPSFADITNHALEWAHAEDEKDRIRSADEQATGALPASRS